MTWCFYEIAMHPEIEAKLLAEIETIAGSADYELGYAAVGECVYLVLFVPFG